MVRGSGFRVWRYTVPGLRIPSFGFKAFGFRFSVSGFPVSGFRLRVDGVWILRSDPVDLRGDENAQVALVLFSKCVDMCFACCILYFERVDVFQSCVYFSSVYMG